MFKIFCYTPNALLVRSVCFLTEQDSSETGTQKHGYNLDDINSSQWIATALEVIRKEMEDDLERGKIRFMDGHN